MANKKINSDYQKIKQELDLYKSYVDKKKIEKILQQKELAEQTLNKVLDLINSNEEICYFHKAKKEIRKPIEEYFRRVK